MVNHNILLNVKQAGPLDTGIEVTQGDYGQVQFLMRVKDDDAFITNATEAKMAFNIPSGYIVEGDASISAGTYTYVFKGNELQSAGKIAAVLTLTLPGGRVSSCGFTFNCRYNPLFDRGIDAGPYLSELENIKQQAQAQVDYLNALIQQLQGDLGETVLTRADLVNNALATTPGIAALDAVMGKTLSDKDADLQQQITQVNSNLNGATLTSNGSVDAVQNEYINVCTLTLKAGHHYLILGHVGSSKNITGSVLSANIIRVSGTLNRDFSGFTSRTTTSNGGGVVTFGYCECQTDCTIALRSYGYSSEEYQLIGYLMALQLK